MFSLLSSAACNLRSWHEAESLALAPHVGDASALNLLEALSEGQLAARFLNVTHLMSKLGLLKLLKVSAGGIAELVELCLNLKGLELLLSRRQAWGLLLC